MHVMIAKNEKKFMLKDQWDRSKLARLDLPHCHFLHLPHSNLLPVENLKQPILGKHETFVLIIPKFFRIAL